MDIHPDTKRKMPPSPGAIGVRHWAMVMAILLIVAAGELATGRNAICACGVVRFWHGALDAGNSQHIADWYTPSHVIHGFLFYGLGRWLLPRWPAGARLVLAVAVEGLWELVENSPLVIDRYREATIALGYSGDSVVNSIADIGWMGLGFALARRLPAWAAVALAILFEFVALWAVRDNLTLNVLMLIRPIAAIKAWQGA